MRYAGLLYRALNPVYAREPLSGEGARRYGVVLREDLSVDEGETRSLRDAIARDRPALPMFDRGGTIDELKARCLRDTHLEPPTAPVFQKWMRREAPAQAAE